MDEVVHAAFALELVVEPRVESHRHTVGSRDRPALLAMPLDEHFLRAQVVIRRAEAATRELLELAGLERLAHRHQLGAELRPEQTKVGLHAELARLDRSEHDLLHPKLLDQLLRVALRERRTFHDEGPQGLAQADARGRARLAAELDDAA